jgi:hypothetical protein
MLARGSASFCCRRSHCFFFLSRACFHSRPRAHRPHPTFAGRPPLALNIVGALIVVGLILAAAAPALTQDEPERVSEPFEASQGQAGGSELLGPQAAVIVLDSKGQEVGPFFPDRAVFRKIDGISFVLGVSTAGFVSSPLGNPLYYTTKNCTGTAYKLVDPSALVVETLYLGESAAVAGILYYSMPGSSRKIVSNSDTDPSRCRDVKLQARR